MKIREPGTPGRGNRHAATPSESQELRALMTVLRRIQNTGDLALIDFVLDQMDKMAVRAAGGHHANPGLLVTYGNPPRTIRPGDDITLGLGPGLGFIEQLKYERTKAPEGYYFHDFGPSDAMYIAKMLDGQHVVLLVNIKGRPLWGEA